MVEGTARLAVSRSCFEALHSPSRFVNPHMYMHLRFMYESFVACLSHGSAHTSLNLHTYIADL